MSYRRTPFLNTYIDNITMNEAVREACKLIGVPGSSYVVTPNIDHIVKLEEDKLFAEVYEHADLILTDGKPLIWISRLLNNPICEKISGSDYFPRICGMAAEEGYSLFLLGAAEGVAEKAADNLTKKFKGLKIAGVYSPKYGFENNDEEIETMIQLVKNAKPDILCIGLGSPKQEKFCYQYKENLEVPLILNIGASIDFEAGNVKRAPRWMSNAGLEWFYRFMSEPKRLFRRYFIDDIKIIPLIVKYRNRI